MIKKLFISLFFLLMMTSMIYAQKSELVISKTPQKNSDEIVGLRDLNGHYCAALKIISPLENLKYKSYNGVVKVVDDPGQDLVYISANERILEVYHSDYAPTKIILSEIGIQLKEKEVWEVHLTGTKKYPLYILTTPEESEIYLDGKLINTTGTIEATLGKHNLNIKKFGYRHINETITVEANMPPLKYNLEEIDLAQVQIKSVPTNAEFQINGSATGKTDKGLWLFPDKYPITITLPGYQTIVDSIDIQENEPNIFTYELKKSQNYGTLNVQFDPSDATLLINKEKFTKHKDIQLSGGNYKIEITKPGYQSLSEWIKIIDNHTLEKSYSLEALTGELRFSINPLDATVEMTKEGKLIEEWKGMKRITDIPIGEYNFLCRASGFETILKSGVVESNKFLDMNITMKKETSGPIFSWIKRHKIATAVIGTGLTAGGTVLYIMSQDDGSGGSVLPGIDDIWPPK